MPEADLSGLDHRAALGHDDPMTGIALCVPFARKEEARKAGARWDNAQRVWICEPGLLNSDAYARLRPFVPRMHRPELAPPFIRPWMVPQTAWGKNLRAVLAKEDWDVVRKAAYQASGHRCRVCGGRGPEWPVEADEGWDYDDERRIQTLKGVIALCPDCHKIRHWGKARIDGLEEAALDHLMLINCWTRKEADKAVEHAFAQWQRRSRHEWASDYGWVTRVHGFRIEAEGLACAATVNRELVREAALRAGQPSSTEVVSAQPAGPEYLGGEAEDRQGIAGRPSIWRYLARLLNR